MPVREGLTEQLLALLTKYEELLTIILSDADDDDDQAAKKIPQLLIQGFRQFTLQIPCNDGSITVRQFS